MNIKVTTGEILSYMTYIGRKTTCLLKYITWSTIIFTHLRVRSGLEKQRMNPFSFPFKAAGIGIWTYRSSASTNSLTSSSY